MDIGVTPELVDKPKAIPLFLYYVEFTCYDRKCKEFFFLENSTKIWRAIINLTSCDTAVVHFCAEFKEARPDENNNVVVLPSDVNVITYALYNEFKKYVSKSSDELKAWGECKNEISIYAEKLDCTRYHLIRQERKLFVQPFKFELKYFKQEFLKQNM